MRAGVLSTLNDGHIPQVPEQGSKIEKGLNKDSLCESIHLLDLHLKTWLSPLESVGHMRLNNY